MKTLIQRAKEIATEAHKGQFRRDGKTPYITHPKAVAHRLRAESEDVIATAWLHDVLEDTNYSQCHLVDAGMPPAVIEAVLDLTKRPHTDYLHNISRAKLNPIAAKVKLADILSNLADSPTRSQIKKYANALLLLLS